MIIKNFESLSTTQRKKIALSIIEAGLEASLPHKLEKIIKHNYVNICGTKIHFKKYDRVFVIGIGKAAYAMAQKVSSLTKVDGGLLIVPKKTSMNLPKFTVLQAGHPIPTRQSVIAAKNLIHFLVDLNSRDFIIFLISGGSSSLVALPDGISLAEKQKVTDLLLKCGANIGEINCIRKHLSQIKGGKLINHLKSDAISLIMSDVVGNDLSTIASGITYYDKTSFLDARKIITKYHLQRTIPRNVIRHLDLGMQKKIPDTPKKARIKNYIISTNENSLDAMNVLAKDMGLSTKVLKCISGDVKVLAKKLVKKLSDKKLNCVIFGGESTVVVKGNGRGGRNQELVSHITINLTKYYENAIVISVGTDGIDGNTKYAGAIWQSDQPIDTIRSYLDKNDTYHFFKKHGGLIFTGFTGTNLMDIGLILRC